MSLDCIDLVDPSEEGARIAGELRAAGFDVRMLHAAELSADEPHRLILVAGDAPQALDVLRAFERGDTSEQVPLILLGAPTEGPFDLADAVHLGAHAFYPRPVPMDRLLRKVKSFLDAPIDASFASMQSMPPSYLSSPPAHAPAFDIHVPRAGGLPKTEALFGDNESLILQVSAEPLSPASFEVAPLSELPPSWMPKERTLELPDDASYAVAQSVVLVSHHGNDAETVLRPLAHSDSSPAPHLPIFSGISESLANQLARADRRVFPDLPRLPFHFRDDTDDPRVLVPAEMLEVAPVPVDVGLDEDFSDSFTYVSPPPGLPSFAPPKSVASQSGGRHGQAMPRRSPSHPADGDSVRSGTDARVVTDARNARSHARGPARNYTEAEAKTSHASELSLGILSPDGVSRSGALVDGELYALLFEIQRAKLDVAVSLQADDATPTRLLFIRGALSAMRCDLAARAYASINRARGLSTPHDNTDAADAIAKRVAAGWISPFELAATYTSVRETIFAELLDAPTLSFVASPLAASDFDILSAETRPFSKPALQVALDHARRTIVASRVRASLPDIHFEHASITNLNDALAFISPALEAATLASQHFSFDEFLNSVPPTEGAPGLLYVLVKIGALQITPAAHAQKSKFHANEIRALVEKAAALADDSDYFEILGVSHDVTARGVEEAFADRANALSRLPLADESLLHLEPLRARALTALADARDVLSRDARRARYAAALRA